MAGFPGLPALSDLAARVRSLVRGLFHRADVGAEMREEFRHHLELRTTHFLREGLSPAEAMRRARIEFGSTERYREEGMEARGLRCFDELRTDARYLIRTLVRDRAFGLTVVLTLSVCIGANVAVYGVVETVLRHPLPFERPDRLVTLYNAYPGIGAERLGNSIPDFFVRRERVAGLENVALYRGSGENVGAGDRIARMPGLRVTPSFFSVLGVEAALGRTFLEEEMEPGRERTVVLTHGYWREHFGGALDILGKPLAIDGRTATIVGVLPETFRLPTHPETRLVHPLTFEAWERSLERWHSNNNYFMLGRLAPGATVERVEAEIAAMNARLAREWRGDDGARLLADAGFHTVVVETREDLVRNVEAALYLLWGAAGFVLLLACANVANLMLARTEARLPELATRVALGAGHGRVARQLLTESAAMGLLGGGGGLALGALGLQLLGVAGQVAGDHVDGSRAGAMGLSLLSAAGNSDMPAGVVVWFDAPVLLYTAALALGAAVLVGVVPMLQILRRDLAGAFRREDRTRTGDRRTVLLRGGLVTGQVGLAFLLLVGAGLMLRSFRAALEVDPGFDPEGVLTAQTALTHVAYPDEGARRRFYDAWLREVRAVPGVLAAGVTTQLPFGPGDGSGSIVPEGYERGPGETVVSPKLAIAGPGYFEAMGIDLVEGRAFEERDGPGQPHVIVIDESLSRRYWPDSSPIGRRMIRGGNPYTIIGVVESIEHEDLTAAAADHVGAYYFTYRQLPTDDMTLVARGAAGAMPAAGGLRTALDRVDPDIPLFDVRTLDDRLAASLGSRRTPMVLLLAFAAVALFLAAVGTYGVLAYSVARRTREIGVRIALGGRPADILTLVLKQGLVPTGIGLAAGGVAAFFLVRFIQSLLFGVRPMDPLALAGAAALLALAAVLACLIPGRRATRVDPVATLAQ